MDFSNDYSDICISEKERELAFGDNDPAKKIAADCRMILPFNSTGKAKANNLAKELASYGEEFLLTASSNPCEAYIFFKNYVAVCWLHFHSGNRPVPDKSIIIPYYNINSVSISEQIEMIPKTENCTQSVRDTQDLIKNIVTIEFSNGLKANMVALRFYRNKKTKNRHTLTPTSMAPYVNAIISDGAFAIATGTAAGKVSSVKDDPIIQRSIDYLGETIDRINTYCLAVKKRMSANYKMFGITPYALRINKLLINDDSYVNELRESIERVEPAELRSNIADCIQIIDNGGDNHSLRELENQISELEKEIELQKGAVENAGFFKKSKESEKLSQLNNERTIYIERLEKQKTEYSKNRFQGLFSVIESASEDEPAVLMERDLISFAKDCNTRNIDQLADQQELILFDLVCKKYAVPKEYRNKQLLELARSYSSEKEAIIEDNKNKEARRKQIAERAKLKELVELVGIQKYLYAIDNERLYNENMLKVLESTRVLSEMPEIIVPSDTSWAVAGGVASAIAGPGVGAAVAVNKMNEKAKLEKLSKEVIEQNINNKIDIENKKAPYERKLKVLIKQENELKEKLCDTDNDQLYFDYYDFNVSSYQIVEGGVLRASVISEPTKPFTIGTMAINVDGSVLLEASLDGKVLGYGYLLGDGFKYGENNGFIATKKYTVDIIPNEADNSFIKGKQYNFSFTPIHMWMIEK